MSEPYDNPFWENCYGVEREIRRLITKNSRLPGRTDFAWTENILNIPPIHQLLAVLLRVKNRGRNLLSFKAALNVMFLLSVSKLAFCMCTCNCYISY